MGNKRSSLKEPRWHSKGDPDRKLHPMSIKYWITLEMMLWVAYDNIRENFNEGEAYIQIDQKKDGEITRGDFEKQIKYQLEWEGKNYFDRGEYELNEESWKYELAVKFVRRLYPKWFKDNAIKFIMGEA